MTPADLTATSSSPATAVPVLVTHKFRVGTHILTVKAAKGLDLDAVWRYTAGEFSKRKGIHEVQAAATWLSIPVDDVRTRPVFKSGPERVKHMLTPLPRVISTTDTRIIDEDATELFTSHELQVAEVQGARRGSGLGIKHANLVAQAQLDASMSLSIQPWNAIRNDATIYNRIGRQIAKATNQPTARANFQEIKKWANKTCESSEVRLTGGWTNTSVCIAGRPKTIEGVTYRANFRGNLTSIMTSDVGATVYENIKKFWPDVSSVAVTRVSSSGGDGDGVNGSAETMHMYAARLGFAKLGIIDEDRRLLLPYDGTGWFPVRERKTVSAASADLRTSLKRMIINAKNRDKIEEGSMNLLKINLWGDGCGAKTGVMTEGISKKLFDGASKWEEVAASRGKEGKMFASKEFHKLLDELADMGPEGLLFEVCYSAESMKTGTFFVRVVLHGLLADNLVENRIACIPGCSSNRRSTRNDSLAQFFSIIANQGPLFVNFGEIEARRVRLRTELDSIRAAYETWFNRSAPKKFMAEMFNELSLSFKRMKLVNHLYRAGNAHMQILVPVMHAAANQISVDFTALSPLLNGSEFAKDIAKRIEHDKAVNAKGNACYSVADLREMAAVYARKIAAHLLQSDDPYVRGVAPLIRLISHIVKLCYSDETAAFSDVKPIANAIASADLRFATHCHFMLQAHLSGITSFDDEKDDVNRCELA